MAGPDGQLELRILGPLELVSGSVPLALGGRKQRAVLALLATRLGTSVSLDELVESLWPDGAPATATTTVQVYVSRLRKLLGADAIRTDAGGYRLALDAEQVDAARFERMAAAGREKHGRPDEAAAAFAGALSLWRGAALADFPYESWAQTEINRLEEQRLACIEERIDAEVALGRHADVVPELETLVASQPLRERLRGQLMLALYRSGRQAEALESYQAFRRLLVEELGIEPSAELRDLNRRLLNQDVTLGWSPPEPPAEPDVRLPWPATPLIGREREVEEIASLLAGGENRLITLTGPGGVGKTRLAIAAAARASFAFADGVVWVGLDAIRDPSLVLPTVALAVGAQDGLREWLRARTVLLVLDNFEQVLDAATDLATMLAESPRLSILVTSRESLRIHAEYEYGVAPLDEDDAVALFANRAGGPAVDSGELLEICRRLDCLPLAVELAAARSKALSPSEVLERLRERLPLLTGGPRDVPARQQTLRAAIEWSYELLAPDERPLFARLSVFAGGGTLDAAERVADLDVDHAQRLVERSLVRRDADRLVMLETIREYAELQLEEIGGADDVRRRHAEYFADFGAELNEGMNGPDQSEWLDRGIQERGNLNAAVEWSLTRGEAALALRLATSIVWLAWIRGPLTEARALMARVLATVSDAPEDERAQALLVSGVAAQQAGDVDAAARYYHEALEIRRRQGDDLRVGVLLGNLGAIALFREEYAEARRQYEESLALAWKIDDRIGAASALCNLGLVALEEGRPRDATKLFQESLPIAEEIGHEYGLGVICQGLAMAALDLGDPAAAREWVRESLRHSRGLESMSGLATCLDGGAEIAMATGDAERAARLLGAADLLFDTSAIAREAHARRRIDRVRVAAEEELGETVFAASVAEGAGLSTDGAVAMLESLVSVSPVGAHEDSS